jgi:hypothetical protein
MLRTSAQSATAQALSKSAHVTETAGEGTGVSVMGGVEVGVSVSEAAAGEEEGLGRAGDVQVGVASLMGVRG